MKVSGVNVIDSNCFDKKNTKNFFLNNFFCVPPYKGEKMMTILILGWKYPFNMWMIVKNFTQPIHLTFAQFSYILHLLITANSVEKSPCTFRSDRVCGCKSGYYYKKLGDTGWECSRCKECGSGQMIAAQCKSLNLTKSL